MRLFCILLTVFVFSVQGLYAQFSDSVFYYTGLFSTGTLNKTDANSSYLFNNTLKFGMKKEIVSLNATASYAYGEQNKTLTNNDVTANLTCDVKSVVKHFYYWGLTNYTSSYSLKINNQFQAGAGAAYNIIDKPNEKLNISDGLLYERNDINTSETVREKYSTLRNSLRLEVGTKVNDIVSLNGNFFYQNSFDNGQDYIIKSSVTLVFKVRKWLNLTSSYTYNRINITKKENVILTYGITVERYY